MNDKKLDTKLKKLKQKKAIKHQKSQKSRKLPPLKDYQPLNLPPVRCDEIKHLSDLRYLEPPQPNPPISKEKKTFLNPIELPSREGITFNNSINSSQSRQVTLTSQKSENFSFICIRRLHWPWKTSNNFARPITNNIPNSSLRDLTKLPSKFNLWMPIRGLIHETFGLGLTVYTPTPLEYSCPRLIKIK